MAVKKTKRKKTAGKKAVKKKTAKKVIKKKKKKKAARTIRKPPEPADIDRLIAECCGVHQVKDGVVFVAFYPKAEKVQIAGSFNDWKPETTPMEKVSENGVWQCKLKLSPGTYHYRQVVDGCWTHDHYNAATELNEYGELNSVFEVV